MLRQYGRGLSLSRGRMCAALLALTLLGTLALAGCSTSGGSLTGGLAGSTVDHPTQPPQVAATGPNGTYAFVYDNQIWLNTSQGPKQATHLVLSNGANISWGPLVWSPDGNSIAFALVENLTPGTSGRSYGSIYYVTVSSDGFGTTAVTPATGSVYGHTYAWYTPRALIYSDRNGLMLFDVGDSDPRVWLLRSALTSDDGYLYTSAGIYGDLAVTSDGGTVVYTAISVNPGSIGAKGVVGSAQLRGLNLGQLANVFGSYGSDDPNLAVQLAIATQNIAQNGTAYSLVSLGKAYADPTGDFVAGAWQLSAGGSVLVTQQIDGVDTGKGVVSSHFCAQQGDPINGYSGCQGILSGAGKYPSTTRAEMALSRNATRVAAATDALYTQSINGGTSAKTALTIWNTAPAWAPDNKTVLATNLISAKTDAAGVLRPQTEVIAYDGSQATTLIAGAENVTWK